MGETGSSEHFIQNVVGCGPFQVWMIFAIGILTKTAASWTVFFMSFGNYNPGWRCLDANDTTTTTITYNNNNNNNTSSYGHSGEVYIKDNCSLFESCKNVQFSPEASTIVSEWGLLCDKAWIPSIIISIQMAGLLVGCSVSGYLADKFGRKKVIFAAAACLTLFSFISIFSVSWQMFTVLRFFLGIFVGFVFSLYYLYLAEFMTIKWRGPLAHLPMTSSIFLVFTIFCNVLKDWRHIHVATVIVGIIGCMPGFFVPESLRWLEVHYRREEFEKSTNRIAKVNGKSTPPEELSEIIVRMKRDITKTSSSHNYWHLFRPGYRMYTLLNIVPWFSVSAINYAIAYGVKSLSGDFYLNLISLSLMQVGFSGISALLPNVIGRKKSGVLFIGLSGLFLLIVAIMQYLPSRESTATAVVALVFTTKCLIFAFWSNLMTLMVELYPTVVRGIALSWGYTIARIGGIAAPFLVPNDADSFYICYLVMGILSGICCCLVSFYPETMGKPLQETFNENTGDQETSTNNDTSKL